MSPAQTVVNQINHNGFAGGCAYDPVNDRVWVFDPGTGTVTAYDRSSGSASAVIATPGFAPVGGFVDPSTGNLWMTDETNSSTRSIRAGRCSLRSRFRWGSTRPH